MYSGKIAVPPGGGGIVQKNFLLFMFSKKIIIKLFKIAPENIQTHT
jgi:hypothetical protein